MKQQVKKRKFHNLLFVKTSFWFGVIMILFTVVLGVIYMRLYEQTIMDNYREQTKQKAEKVAKRCADLVFAGNPDSWQQYLYTFTLIENAEVWSVSNDDAKYPLPGTYAFYRRDFEKQSFYQSSYGDILNNVFHNIPASSTDYSEAHLGKMITIGVPVLGINGEVAGGILMNVRVENQERIVNSSWRLIFISGAIALALAFVTALFFVRPALPAER